MADLTKQGIKHGADDHQTALANIIDSLTGEKIFDNVAAGGLPFGVWIGRITCQSGFFSVSEIYSNVSLTFTEADTYKTVIVEGAEMANSKVMFVRPETEVDTEPSKYTTTAYPSGPPPYTGENLRRYLVTDNSWQVFGTAHVMLIFPNSGW